MSVVTEGHTDVAAEFWAFLREGNAEKVQELLQRCPDLAAAVDGNGASPLKYAVRARLHAIAEILADQAEPPAASALPARSTRPQPPPADWPCFRATTRLSRLTSSALRTVVAQWNSVILSLQSIEPRDDEFPGYNEVRLQFAPVFTAPVLEQCADRAPGQWLELLQGNCLELKMTALLSSIARYTAHTHVHVTLCDVGVTDRVDGFDQGKTIVLFSSEFHRPGRGMTVSDIVYGEAARFPASLPTWSELVPISRVPISPTPGLARIATFLGSHFHVPAKVCVWQMSVDPIRLVVLADTVTFGSEKEPWFVVDDDQQTKRKPVFVPMDLRLTAAVVFFLARYCASKVFVAVKDRSSELFEALECNGGVVLVQTGCHIVGAPPSASSSSSSQQRLDEEDAHAVLVRTGRHLDGEAPSSASGCETTQLSSTATSTRGCCHQPPTGSGPAAKNAGLTEGPETSPCAVSSGGTMPLSRSALKTVGYASSVVLDRTWHAGIVEAADHATDLRQAIGRLRGKGWSNKAIAAGAGYRGRSNARFIRRMLEQRCDVLRRLQLLLAAAPSLDVDSLSWASEPERCLFAAGMLSNTTKLHNNEK